ncbi:hypothetical protein BJF83_23570 [Nocardiopsis sp. CNR-923]|uniref:hypothetical protein n=1 Tax=Nocardiopsis sp. CNR-923 TaxID=1904965 RepID=UPI00096738DD|nr:hypothetical protein [Nocardiopsis sp. CNR-923]OLT24910.1 hypothetical protein BJF83_23570 [Nocardiopsis sp. CNR-923]
MTHTSYDNPTGRPPLAVWPCAPTPHHPTHEGTDGVVPDRLAHRLVGEYTRPGQVVADVTGTQGRVAAIARLRGRSAEVPARTAYDQGEQVTVFGVAWADLTVTVLPAVCEEDPRRRERRTQARVVFAATLTRPGGIVAVITPVGHAPSGEVVDPAPGVVRAATCAGLVYVQHVIALTAPICEVGLGATIPVRGDVCDLERGQACGPDREEAFDPDWEEGEVGAGLPASVAEAAATITSPAHLNVSVFRLPKRYRTATAEVRGEVGA